VSSLAGRTRAELARDAFWGLLPVLAEEIEWQAGAACVVQPHAPWCTPQQRPATGLSLAEYVSVVERMSDDELEQIVLIYDPHRRADGEPSTEQRRREDQP
jgi:hypothetical protein